MSVYFSISTDSNLTRLIAEVTQDEFTSPGRFAEILRSTIEETAKLIAKDHFEKILAEVDYKAIATEVGTRIAAELAKRALEEKPKEIGGQNG